MTTRGPVIRLGVFAAAMLGLFALIVGVVDRPVGGDTASFEAAFTDANGLATGADVRSMGLRIGKVDGVRLDGGVAVVAMAIESDATITTQTRLAIRYQSMTGQRYVDVIDGAPTASRQDPGVRIPATRTVPSFDITTLFNGLQPVLRTLSPGDLNRLTTSMLAIVDGDGSGVGAALSALHVLADHAADRQATVSRMLANLGEVTDRIGGRSPHLATMLSRLADVYESLQVNMNGLLDFALTSPPVLTPIDNLLATLGFTVHSNPGADSLVARAFPDPEAAADVLSRLPTVISTLNTMISRASRPAGRCTKGDADVPAPLAVLFQGREVQVCKR